MLVRVAIRLRFVKVPGVSGVRVFRDVMDVLDRETRSFEDLSNMVERKLSFMQLPSYDFIVFYVEEGGERVVVDDAYFDELLELWITSATDRKCAHKSMGSKKKSRSLEEKRALSATIAILGCNSSINNSQVNSDADKSTSDSDIDSCNSESESEDSVPDGLTLSKRSATVHCTFEVEVNSLNTFNANMTSSSSSSHAVRHSPPELTPLPREPLHILEEQAALSSSPSSLQTNKQIKNNNKDTINNITTNSTLNVGALAPVRLSITSEPNVHINENNNNICNKANYNNVEQQMVQRLPLTAQNLNTVMAQQQEHHKTECNNTTVNRHDVSCKATSGNNENKNNDEDDNDRGYKLGEKKAEGFVGHHMPQCTDKCLVRINELTRFLPPHMSISPPLSSSCTIRCIVMAIRFKSPRPTISIAELELCDADCTTEQITAVTFDSLVQRAIQERLRGDGRQVLELTHFMLRRKTEMDVRYQYNTHPLQLRLDRSCKMEIVQIRHTSILAELHLPVSTTPSTPNQVITTRDEMSVAPVLHFSDLIGVSQRNSNVNGNNNSHVISSAMSLGSVNNGDNVMAHAPIISSSTPSSTRRRTTFSFTNSITSSSSSSNTSGSTSSNNNNNNNNNNVGGNVGCVSASINGVVPSLLGRQLQSEQSKYITCHSNILLSDASTWTNSALDGVEQDRVKPISELAHSHVSTQELRQREEVLGQRMGREEQRKDRIRRKGRVSSCCILCGLDCDDEAQCMPIVRSLLTANRQNRGTHIPTMAELRHALSDRRINTRVSKNQTGNDKRLVCQSHFVNLERKSLHVIHPRCAHLCTAYQRGNEIEDFVMCELKMQICSLCGEPGATVCCYHPDCDEMYHTVCALFSNGYVNFGQKDPYLPCAACPRHTLVKLWKRNRDEERNTQSNSNERCNSSGNSDSCNGEEVLHVDQSCWYDGIAFDSRVVESTDLRDPDENEGL